MAFSDYKAISQVQTDFGIVYLEQDFLEPKAIPLTPFFLEEFLFTRENIDVFTSEAARTDLVITPLLLEVYKYYHQKTSFWIQKSITFTEQLQGTPDYMIATKSALGKSVLETPLLLVVEAIPPEGASWNQEAKKNDFEQRPCPIGACFGSREGWTQCLAELIAAQGLNKQTQKAVYGIVTDGELWKFGKLFEKQFQLNTTPYTIGQLEELFGTLHQIFQLALLPELI